MYHNDRSDQTGRHTPGGLMHIFQFIIFIRILDTESLCEAVTEIVAGAGLEGFSIMH